MNDSPLDARIDAGLARLGRVDGAVHLVWDWGLPSRPSLVPVCDPTGPADLGVSCAEFLDRIDDLAACERPEHFGEEFADHAAGCAACSRELALARRVARSLPGLPWLEPPRRIWTALVSRLGLAGRSARPVRASLVRMLRLPFRVLGPALALGVLFVGLFVGLPQAPSPTADEVLAAAATTIGGDLERDLYCRSTEFQWDYVESEFKTYKGRLAARRAEGR